MRNPERRRGRRRFTHRRGPPADHHPGHSDPERPGREGPADPRADGRGAEALQLPAGPGRPVRGARGQPRPLRDRSVRVAAVQAAGGPGRPPRRLRGPAVRHGVGGQGGGGRHRGQAPGPARQGHEVQGRIHDLDGPPQGARRAAWERGPAGRCPAASDLSSLGPPRRRWTSSSPRRATC